MINANAAWLLVAIVTGAAAPTEEPEAWKRYRQAANEAVKARDFAKAEAVLAQMVREAQELGDHDLRQVAPLEELAAFYMKDEVNRCADAEPLIRRALAVEEKAKGRDDPDVADTLLKLALCRFKVDEDNGDEVERLQQRALSIVEKARGKDDLEVATVLHDVAIVHLTRKQPDKAEAELKRAVAIRERALGPQNATLATLLDDLGDLHMMSLLPFDILPSDPPTAIDDPKTAQLIKKLERLDTPEAFEARTERHRREAESYYKRALAIREKVLAPDDPEIAESLRNLVQLAFFFGRGADAEPYVSRLMLIHERTHEGPSEAKVEVLRMWVEAARLREDWIEAEHRAAQCQSVVEQRQGAESEEVAGLLVNRADFAIEARRFDTAEQLLKRSLETRAQLIGPRDPRVREARHLMRGTYQDHMSDRTAFRLWNQLSAWSEQRAKLDSGGRYIQGNGGLAEIVDLYSKLLCRSNRVLPLPTEEDLAYLKKFKAAVVGCSVDDLTRLKSLQNIDPLDDEGLSHIARMYAIERVFLDSRKITDAGLGYLKNLESLRELNLTWARVTDAGVAHLAGLVELKELRLDSTSITDAGLANLKGMKNLELLGVSGTNISDKGLELLTGIESLRQLRVRGTNVSPAGVERLRRARPKLEVEDFHVTLPDIERVSPAPKLVEPPEFLPLPPTFRKAFEPATGAAGDPGRRTRNARERAPVALFADTNADNPSRAQRHQLVGAEHDDRAGVRATWARTAPRLFDNASISP